MDMEDISGKRTAFGMRERRAAKDRLQPALLDRLTDNEPLKKKESRDSVMITYDTLRHAVLRDLRWLLNTVNIETVDELDAFPQVRQSTANFGVEALAGRRMSEIDWVDMEQSIKTAIIHFEPRILADSLEVACVSEVTSLEHHNVLSLEIRGKLWCNPYPREFLFRTDIDLESGHMDLQEQGVA